MKFKEFDKPEYFVNRELSWIKFDDRVLSEARDKNLPLLSSSLPSHYKPDSKHLFKKFFFIFQKPLSESKSA